MKYKRYCINIDQSISYPTLWPLAWTVLFLVIFLLRLLVNGSRNMDTFWVDFLIDGELFWYLSGPILLVLSAIISVFLIVFPVSYVEFHDDFMLVHRAFKEDRIIKYETIQFSRLRPNRRKKCSRFILVYWHMMERLTQWKFAQILLGEPFGSHPPKLFMFVWLKY